MQNWLNRGGLLLQFVALFLVTPEIFGEDKVRAATMRYVVQPLVRLVAFLRRHPVLRALGYLFVAVLLLFVYFVVHAGIAGGLTVVVDGNSVAQVVLVGIVVVVVPYLLWTLAKLLSGLAGRAIDRAATVHRSFLPIGASLFAIGFVLLMAATFTRAA